MVKAKPKLRAPWSSLSHQEAAEVCWLNCNPSPTICKVGDRAVICLIAACDMICLHGYILFRVLSYLYRYIYYFSFGQFLMYEFCRTSTSSCNIDRISSPVLWHRCQPTPLVFCNRQYCCVFTTETTEVVFQRKAKQPV